MNAQSFPKERISLLAVSRHTKPIGTPLRTEDPLVIDAVILKVLELKKKGADEERHVGTVPSGNIPFQCSPWPSCELSIRTRAVILEGSTMIQLNSTKEIRDLRDALNGVLARTQKVAVSAAKSPHLLPGASVVQPAKK